MMNLFHFVLQAQVLLHFMRLSYDAQPLSQQQIKDGYSNFVPTAKDLEAYIVESCKMVSHSYGIFKSKAAEQVDNINLRFYDVE